MCKCPGGGPRDIFSFTMRGDGITIFMASIALVCMVVHMMLLPVFPQVQCSRNVCMSVVIVLAPAAPLSGFVASECG